MYTHTHTHTHTHMYVHMHTSISTYNTSKQLRAGVTSRWLRHWPCQWEERQQAPLARARRRPPKTWGAVWESTLSSSTAPTRWTSEGLAASTKVGRWFPTSLFGCGFGLSSWGCAFQLDPVADLSDTANNATGPVNVSHQCVGPHVLFEQHTDRIWESSS